MAQSDSTSHRRDLAGQASEKEERGEPSKALPRFLRSLSAQSQPHLLDLGPIVGHNVMFFGERLGCKFQVEELSKDLDRFAREDKLAELPEFLSTRFSQKDESFDGILCWDLIDHLDEPAAQVLAKQLTRLLRPGGVLLALFASGKSPSATPTYTRFVVVDENNVQHRPYPAARAKQRPLANRDILQMFAPLRVTEQFLLKNNIREVLLKKVVAGDRVSDLLRLVVDGVSPSRISDSLTISLSELPERLAEAMRIIETDRHAVVDEAVVALLTADAKKRPGDVVVALLNQLRLCAAVTRLELDAEAATHINESVDAMAAEIARLRTALDGLLSTSSQKSD